MSRFTLIAVEAGVGIVVILLAVKTCRKLAKERAEQLATFQRVLMLS